MVDDPRLIRVAGGVQNFIYRLEPFGMFSKHNQGWLSRIYDALIYHFIGREVLSGDELHGRLRAAEAWAWKYWDGSPCPDLRPPNVEVWEYLASDVLVVACEYNGEWWSADIEEE